MQNVDFVKLDISRADFLDSFERLLAAVVEVVDHYDLVAGIQQFDYGMAADITGPTGDQDSHEILWLGGFGTHCCGLKYHYCLGRCPAKLTLDEFIMTAQ